jgi:tetratricopeptide (TPR) repeat protein
MDKDGQLIFNDDPFLIGINTAYQLIEEGKFSDALGKLDELLGRNPDYPGLADAYRTAKFWKNRQRDIEALEKGKSTADFLMKQWDEFRRYASDRGMISSAAYASAMKFVFFQAAEQYKIAFVEEQSTVDNFDLLVNLGVCFITLGEYKHAAETLEYARISYRGSAKLLALLGEAYFHTGEVPKALYCFKEAFFINPSEIDLGLIRAKPVVELAALAMERKPGADPREWIPVFAYLRDVFYVKRQLNSQQVENTQRELYALEKNLSKKGMDGAAGTSLIPRLINKYLWMLDYFEYQHYDFSNISDIRARLVRMDRELFEEYFKNKSR